MSGLMIFLNIFVKPYFLCGECWPYMRQFLFCMQSCFMSTRPCKILPFFMVLKAQMTRFFKLIANTVLTNRYLWEVQNAENPTEKLLLKLLLFRIEVYALILCPAHFFLPVKYLEVVILIEEDFSMLCGRMVEFSSLVLFLDTFDKFAEKK